MTDFAWLIEAPGQNYLGTREIGHHPEFYWTQDAAKATRFMSAFQADGVAMAVRRMEPKLWAFAVNLGEARPVEHGYMSDPPAPHVPEGWRLVPVEATEAMVKAGGHTNSEWLNDKWLNDNAPIGEHLYAMPMRGVWSAMLSAAPAAQSVAVGGWRDIASAPRDGTRILLWMPDFGAYATACSWREYGKKTGWYGDAGQSLNHATHWQPLPPPPEGAR